MCSLLLTKVIFELHRGPDAAIQGCDAEGLSASLPLVATSQTLDTTMMAGPHIPIFLIPRDRDVYIALRELVTSTRGVRNRIFSEH